MNSFLYSQDLKEGLIYFHSCDALTNQDISFIDVGLTVNRLKQPDSAIAFTNNSDSLIFYIDYDSLMRDSTFTLSFWVRDNTESYDARVVKFAGFELRIHYNGWGGFAPSDSIQGWSRPDKFRNMDISYNYWVHVMISYNKGTWVLQRTLFNETKSYVWDEETQNIVWVSEYDLETPDPVNTFDQTIDSVFNKIVFGLKLDGAIDDIRIYNRLLTNEEKKLIRSNTTPIILSSDDAIVFDSETLYPNPVLKDGVLSSTINNKSISAINVFDSNGNLIIQTDHFPIDFENSKQGLYIVKVQMKNGTLKNEKLICIW